MGGIRHLLLVGALACAPTGLHAQIAVRTPASTATTASAATGVAFGAIGNAANRNGCGQINPSLPGGITAGDLLIAVISSGAQPTLTMTGWTQLMYNAGAANHSAAIYWRIATGADPNTIDQQGSCNSLIARIARFTGVDSSQPFATEPLAGSNWSYQNANSVTTGTQTVNFSGAMVVFTAHSSDDDSFGNEPGFTRAFTSSTTSGNDSAIALYYGTPGTTPPFTAGPYNVSKDQGTDPNHGVVLALRPAIDGLTLNVPAGTVQNDVMITSLTMRPCSNTSGGACTTTVTAPAGWTLVRSIDQTTGAGTGGYGHRHFVYRRVAGASEPSSYTWSFGGTPGHGGAAGAILSFSGVDTSNPIVAENGQATPAAYTHAAPSINTGAVANTMLVSSHSANSSATWTFPGGMTERVDISSLPVSDDLGLSLEVNTQAFAGTGATGTRTATHSNPPANDTGAAHLLALRPAPAIAHYSISVASNTVANCDYAEVTIVGHDAAHNPVNVPSGRTVTLSTSTGTGVWQAGLVAGTGAWVPSGLNNGAASYAWPGSESGFTVRLRQGAVTSLSVNVSDGAAVEAPTEDPTVSFVNSAFRISNGANGSLAIGTHIAGKPSNVGFGAQSLFLQAVRTDTSTGACVSLFPSGSDVSIQVGAQCTNPASCSQNVTLASSSPSGNTATFVPNGAYPATMNFRFTTANAEAPFTLNYFDAGRITLQFRAALPSPPAGQFVQGTSNAFVVRPFGLRISGVTTSATPLPTDPVFAVAGTNFNATVTAVQWKSGDDTSPLDGVPDTDAQIAGNAATPNFGQETTPATATLTHTLNAPAGGDAGTLAGSTTFASFTSGTRTQAVSWSEVGFINLFARTTNYLGAVDVSNSAAGHAGVGRFRPDHFFVSASALTNRAAAACPGPGSAFTYMNEGMQVTFTLQARNGAAAPAVTRNYAGAYAKLDPATPARLGLGAVGVAPGGASTNLTSRLGTPFGTTGSFVAGAASVAATVVVARGTAPTNDNPDGPFTNTRIGVAAAEPAGADGVTMRPADLNVDVDGAGGNDRVQVGPATEMRFGRLRLENAVGSEKLALPVPVQVQYWNGTAFVTNAADSCTKLPRSALVLGPYTGALDPAGGNCRTFVQQDPIAFSNGIGAATLAAPSGAVGGSVTLTANLGTSPTGIYCNDATSTEDPATAAARSYLLGRWNDGVNPDGNANTAYDDNPSARAAFGLYSGQPNNFIYFRENY